MVDDILLLVNPHAGRVDDEAIGRVCRRLPSRAAAEVAVTDHPAEVPAVLDRLGERPLLVMGGDGTLHVVIAALRRRGCLSTTAIGFLPAGTANAFARAMPVPLDAADALDAVLAGSSRRLDLFVADDGHHVAVNDLHTGLGVPATELAHRLKPVLRQLTYPVANTVAGLRAAGWDLEVAVDGEPLVGKGERVLAVAIGNTELVGDGTPMWPDARPDDGRADVVAIMAAGRRQRAKVGWALRRGHHVDLPEVRRARGAEITLAGDVPGHNADGEVAPEAGPATWRVVPSAWQLLGAHPGRD